jgi:hypothetical protein
MSLVHGWNLFHAISSALKKFSHILTDLGPVGILLAASMGLPDVAGAGIFELLMKAHAGDKGAREHVKAVLARGGKWPAFIDAAAEKLRKHPQWHAFQEHVRKHVHAHSPEAARPSPGHWASALMSGEMGRGGHGGHHHHHRKHKPLPPQPQEPDDEAQSPE